MKASRIKISLLLCIALLPSGLWAAKKYYPEMYEPAKSRNADPAAAPDRVVVVMEGEMVKDDAAAYISTNDASINLSGKEVSSKESSSARVSGESSDRNARGGRKDAYEAAAEAEKNPEASRANNSALDLKTLAGSADDGAKKGGEGDRRGSQAERKSSGTQTSATSQAPKQSISRSNRDYSLADGGEVGERYHIVVGSFRTRDNADKLCGELKAKGCEARVAYSSDDKYRVFYYSTDSESDLRARLETARKEYPDAWMLDIRR